MTLSVDPTALDGAGSALVATGEAIGTATTSLTSALSGCGSMCGNDPVGEEMGHAYDRSAQSLIEAFVTARNGITNLGDGVRFSAFNYSMAEAQSDMSGRAAPLPAPQRTGKMALPSTPSSVGAGDSAPAGWGWVAKYIGMIWPNGDSGQLRAAAAAWTAAGTQLLTTEANAAGALGTVGAQQIPEGAAIGQAFSQSLRAASQVMAQCTTVASQLISYAAHIDSVHAAIIDLLSRICDPLTGIKEIWDFLTDEDEDEIKKIADDIKTVVDNFKSESEALVSQIASTAAAAETAVTEIAGAAEKEWDQFLHGTDAGRAVNQVGQYAKGTWGEGIDMIGGMLGDVWKYNAVRMAVDPEGYLHDVGERAGQMAPLVGLGGEGAPGVADVWKQVGKDVSHWDLWKTNPAEAAGRTVTDIASMITPGGAAAKVDRATAALEQAGNAVRNTAEHLPGAAADAAKATEKSAATPVRPPDVAPPAKAPEPPPARTGEPPPPTTPKSPEGAPGAASAAEPKSAPAHAPAPVSPTEARAPVDAPRHAAPAEAPRGEPSVVAPQEPLSRQSEVAASSSGSKMPLDVPSVAGSATGAVRAVSEPLGAVTSSTGNALSGAGEHLGGVADNLAGDGGQRTAASAGSNALGEVTDHVSTPAGAHERSGATGAMNADPVADGSINHGLTDPRSASVEQDHQPVHELGSGEHGHDDSGDSSDLNDESLLPFEGMAGSIRTVNPGGGDMNCVNCVITTDQMLDGVKLSAALDGPKPVGFLETYFDAKFSPVGGRSDIESAMVAAGAGSRGVVFASRGPGLVGHVFNVVNQGGEVRFLDGQPGTVASFDGYRNFFFMRYR
ncbi:MAG: ADP-ribosyltransferse [Mycobacterium sp.]|nr:ADP-ribosyltransferse [Mycobacterium sp.]